MLYSLQTLIEVCLSVCLSKNYTQFSNFAGEVQMTGTQSGPVKRLTGPVKPFSFLMANRPTDAVAHQDLSR